jgi:thiamine monophosphate synthase
MALGADAVLLAPVFATLSHPQAVPIGPVRFACWAETSGVAVYALGGIDARAARRLIRTRVRGFAAVGALATNGHP